MVDNHRDKRKQTWLNKPVKWPGYVDLRTKLCTNGRRTVSGRLYKSILCTFDGIRIVLGETGVTWDSERARESKVGRSIIYKEVITLQKSVHLKNSLVKN